MAQIYKITNKINGKSYIGQDSKDRPNYFGSGKYIKRAISKYGKHNFDKTIITICKDFEELDRAEIFWIAKLNTVTPNGYNITNGGGGFRKSPTQEHRDKISKAKKRNYCFRTDQKKIN